MGNLYDLAVSVLDLCCVVVLSLAACTSSHDGLVCSLCGFASSMVLEFVYVLWLCVAAAWDATDEGLTTGNVGWLLLYTIVPYLGLLIVRCYVLVKAQALRRSIKKNNDFRKRLSEKDRLVVR